MWERNDYFGCFYNDGRDVSKILRAIVLAFLGVCACMHISLNIIIFLLPFFFSFVTVIAIISVH